MHHRDTCNGHYNRKETHHKRDIPKWLSINNMELSKFVVGSHFVFYTMQLICMDQLVGQHEGLHVGQHVGLHVYQHEVDPHVYTTKASFMHHGKKITFVSDS